MGSCHIMPLTAKKATITCFLNNIAGRTCYRMLPWRTVHTAGTIVVQQLSC
ncbi:hypothetical protein SLEP1_g23118 [Rubroshorea leprosula]|uniref:Uncharacterized protein n=1 Tax=Rubroshorea leprosula TaxID=152421 RepID=A0AAV5JIL9_9ROSI|nr:hypothetical protein SLEP1_g23118 [Rubroshorea leprosula]